MPPSFNLRPLFAARWRPAWQVLLALLVAAVSWLAFKPGEADDTLAHLDKLRHIAAFLCMAGVASMASTAGPRAARSIALMLMVYGAFIELVQSRIPTRSGSVGDLVADALGIAAGLLLVHGLRKRS